MPLSETSVMPSRGKKGKEEQKGSWDRWLRRGKGSNGRGKGGEGRERVIKGMKKRRKG